MSVGEAAATTLLSYLLVRLIQWIVTSNIFAVLGRVFLVFALSGIVAVMFTPSSPIKGLNNKHYIPTKKHV